MATTVYDAGATSSFCSHALPWWMAHQFSNPATAAALSIFGGCFYLNCCSRPGHGTRRAEDAPVVGAVVAWGTSDDQATLRCRLVLAQMHFRACSVPVSIPARLAHRAPAQVGGCRPGGYGLVHLPLVGCSTFLAQPGAQHKEGEHAQEHLNDLPSFFSHPFASASGVLRVRGSYKSRLRGGHGGPTPSSEHERWTRANHAPMGANGDAAPTEQTA